MAMRMIHVDAFTPVAFNGNPAAVCLLSDQRDDVWLQRVASEMNLSETAFLLWQRGMFQLRWFTPTTEVELCGHATLASAHVLWEEEYLQPDEEARFHTLSGILTARKDGDWIEMDFPSKIASPAPAPEGLLEALGVTVVQISKNKFDYLIEVETEEVVREIAPDMTQLAQISMRGVIVTSRASGQEYDFVSRFFAPSVGVNEDPVTGSAHCCLAPYWSEKLGRDELIGYQASARGGYVRVRAQGERVLLGGQAVTVLRGDLLA